jgi:RNA polymerase sigma factor (sigma-70 family)
MTSARTGIVLKHIGRLTRTRGALQPTDAELLERFTAQRDDAAFAAMVERHGPMVLTVCRSILRHHQDAEDAFQATFLVLARKADTIREPEALAGWLYEVAHNAALKAQVNAARRRDQERRAVPLASASPALDITVRELQRVLHEELRRLPEKYRLPLVLCYLEDRTHEAAAAQLGWSDGTFRGRLERGRERLRRRLAARGMALSTLVCAAAVVPTATAASLVGLTVRAAVTGAASARAAGLAEGITRAAFSTKLKIAAAVLLTVGLFAGAGALVRQALAAGEEPLEGLALGARPEPPRPAAVKPSTDEKTPNSVEVSGRVIDPDGKAVTGAMLLFLCPSVEKVAEKVSATSAADGGFHFSVARSIDVAGGAGSAWDHTYVVAAAEGHGLAWARVRPEASGALTLRLVKDDVPIQGRIIDLQGKPVAGATVRIDGELFVPTKGDLADWLKALAGNKWPQAFPSEPNFTNLSSPFLAALFPPVQTGPDGGFQIKGIGRDRVARLRIEGLTIATQHFTVMTRKGERPRLAPPSTPSDRLVPAKFMELQRAMQRVVPYGSASDLPAMPTRAIVGVVHDKDSGKPLAGVTIRSHYIAGAYDPDGLNQTRTDKDGRYRLVGLPKGPGNAIIAEAYDSRPRAEDLPYLPAIRQVGDTPGLEAVTIDLGLKHGVWLKGHITDKATGRPVRGGCDYFCFEDNPAATELPLPRGLAADRTDKDGAFRTVILPGRGFIAVRADRDEYRSGVGVDRIAGPRNGELLVARPYLLHPGTYHTLVEVSARPDDESIQCDVVVDPGRTLQGTVLGPDGKSLAGARVAGLTSPGRWEPDALASAVFAVRRLGSGERRQLEIVHEEKKLAGWLELRGDEKEQVRVRLEPWGSVTGRLVAPDAESLTKVVVEVGSLHRALPGKDGKFRIDGLAPGQRYGLRVLKVPVYVLEINGKGLDALKVGPGETKDLGDIEVKPME